MLINFLADMVSNMDSFRDDINTIYLYHHEGNLIATANHPNRLVFYQVRPLINMSDHLAAPAYLGALGYLRSMLGSSMMKKDQEPQIEIEYREKDGAKLCAASMNFIAKEFQASFECTNPDLLNEKDRVRQFPKPSDAIHFSFTKNMRKKFDEVAKFNTPKSDARLFMLAFDGKYVRAIFGNGKHTSNLILTEEVQGNVDQKFQSLISLDRFRAMVRLTSDHDGKASYHPKSFWVVFDTLEALHTIAIPSIRDIATQHE